MRNDELRETSKGDITHAERFADELDETAHQAANDVPLKEYAPDGATVDELLAGFLRFCLEVLQIRIWSKQRQVARAVIEHRRTAVKSGHSTGKTMISACLLEWWFSCRGRCVYTTAPGKDAVTELLWKQVGVNRENASRSLPGQWFESGKIKVEGQPNWWAKGFSTNKAERAQGKHEVGLLIIADEAAGLMPFIWIALESSMASEEVRMLALGNPNDLRERFWQIFHDDAHKDMWEHITISSLSVPNITGEEDPVPGLATVQWAEDQKRLYKDEPNLYLNRVLGEFSDNDAEQKVLPEAWIAASIQLWRELEEEEEELVDEPKIHAAFLDVAGFGKDKSALTYLRGQRFHVANWWDDSTDEGLMKTAEWVHQWVTSLPEHQKPAWLAVDCDAVGAGCFARLAQLRKENRAAWGRCQVRRFHWAWGASKKDQLRYVNIIDELHWKLREALDPTQPRTERLALPPGNPAIGLAEQEVKRQLNLRKYKRDRRERIKVETKEELSNRRAGSPDLADSIVGTMWQPVLVKVAAA